MINSNVQIFFEHNIYLLDNNNFDKFFERAEGEFIPSTVNDIGIMLETAGIDPIKHMTYIPEGYFFMSSKEQYIIPPNIRNIHYKAFNSSDIQKLHVPKNVVSIAEEAFADCDFLDTVLIDEGLELIGDYAFFNCLDLSKVTLPSTLKYIGNKVFSECQKLKVLDYQGTSEQWNKLGGTEKIKDTSIVRVNCSDKIIKL